MKPTPQAAAICDEGHWVWDYEVKHLGCWPGEEYHGHNLPVEVVTKQHHAQALARCRAEVWREAAQLARDCKSAAAQNHVWECCQGAIAEECEQQASEREPHGD